MSHSIAASASPALGSASTITSDQYMARLGTYAMVGGTIAALVFAVDPTGSSIGMSRLPFIKYLTSELALAALLFFLLARWNIHLRERSVVLLAAFVAMVLAGSIFTLLAQHRSLEESFLGRGLGLLAIFPAFLLFLRQPEHNLYRRSVRVPILLAGLTMVAGLVVWRLGIHFVDQPHIYHEEIFVPASGALLVYAATRGRLSHALLLALLSGGLLSLKYTGILATGMVASLLAMHLWRARGTRTSVQLRRVSMVQFVIWSAVIAAVVIAQASDILPSGSPAVRLFTYAERLGRFLDHPVAGTGYVGSPFLSLARADTPENLVIPSHSDVLDMLAFGGLIGLVAFALPVSRAAWRGVKALPTFVSQRDWLGAYSTGVVLVFVMEMVFNPVWNQPSLVFLFSVALAYLLTLNTRAFRETDPQ